MLRINDIKDDKEVATYKGHITISADDTLCGFKYTYDYPRIDNRVTKRTYLKYILLSEVECKKCRELATGKRTEV